MLDREQSSREHSAPIDAHPDWRRLSLAVIGIGADGQLGSDAARSALRRADVAIGSPRQLDLVRKLRGDAASIDDGAPAGKSSARLVEWPRPMVPGLVPLMRDFIGRNVVVLASGDPLFHGVASTLARELPGAAMTVFPAMSSYTLACARLGWPTHDTPHVSLVTGDIAEIGRYAQVGRRFLVLARSADSLPDIANYLRDVGIDATLTALSDLGSLVEKISVGTVDAPPALASNLAIIAVEPTQTSAGTGWLPLTPGLTDSCYETDGQLTKSDVRALTISALAPRSGEHLWDIGGGSGSIAIEWLRCHPSLTARIFEVNSTRSQRIARNVRRFGVSGLAISGGAPDHFPTDEHPDCVFIGGGVTVDGLLDGAWEHLAPGGRIVANAVTAESVATLWQARVRWGGALRRIAIETETTIGSFTAYKPTYPVWQWRATKER